MENGQDTPVYHPHFTKAYIRGQNLIEQVLGGIRSQQNQRASGRTLVVGAGTGLDIPKLSAAVSDAVLLEPDGAMVAYLRRKYPDLTVLEDPAESIRVTDMQFDTVISSLVLCTVKDVEGALAEIYRVLKPGGSYLFMEHVQHHRPVGGYLQNLLNPVWKRVGGGCNLNRNIEGELRNSQFTVRELRLVRPSFLIPVIAGMAVRPK